MAFAASALLLLLGTGCTSGIELVLHGDLDAAAPSEADATVGADSEREVDADAGAGAEVDAGVDDDTDVQASMDGGFEGEVEGDVDDEVGDGSDADAGTAHDVIQDGDEDAEAEADATPEDEAEAEVGDEDAEDAAAEADAEICANGWYDSTTGLCWQDPNDGTLRNWAEAVTYCDELVLGGRTDWHLPTIDELRSLIRGCPATMTGGACGVTDACLDRTCLSDACSGCPYGGGPGVDGAYWPPELSGSSRRTGWSSSGLSTPHNGWAADFRRALVGADYYLNVGPTRCVRPGP